MTVTTDYLAQFGLTLQEAHDFVFAHLDDPAMILAVAAQYGVSSTMLGEIAGGYSVTEVRGYFAEHGLDDGVLDRVGGQPGGYYQSAPADPAMLVGTAPITSDIGY